MITQGVNINKGSVNHYYLFQTLDKPSKCNFIADLLLRRRTEGASIAGFAKMVTKEEAIFALEFLSTRGTPQEKQKVITILQNVRAEWEKSRRVAKGTNGSVEMFWATSGTHQETADGRYESNSGESQTGLKTVRHVQGYAWTVIPGWTRVPGETFAGDFFSRKRGFKACSPEHKGSALDQVLKLPIPEVPVITPVVSETIPSAPPRAITATVALQAHVATATSNERTSLLSNNRKETSLLEMTGLIQPTFRTKL